MTPKNLTFEEFNAAMRYEKPAPTPEPERNQSYDPIVLLLLLWVLFAASKGRASAKPPTT